MERTGSMMKLKLNHIDLGRGTIRGLYKGISGGRGVGLIRREGMVSRFLLLVFAWGLIVQP